MQIANYVTPNIIIIVQKSPKSLAAGALPQTPLGKLTALPRPLAALGWDGDFKTLYPRQEILGTRLVAMYFWCSFDWASGVNENLGVRGYSPNLPDKSSTAWNNDTLS